MRMYEITVSDVDSSNWFQCTQLEPSKAQQEVFPCPVVFWLAESKYETSFRPMAIYAGSALVGFAVYGQDPDDGMYWIVALLIDAKYQKRGYGRAAVLALVELMSSRHSCTHILVGHRVENDIAAKFYDSLGFSPIEERSNGHGGVEVVRKFCICQE